MVASTRKRLLDASHEYTISTIYSTIQRNGRNNPTIAAALLDAIEAEQDRQTPAAPPGQSYAASWRSTR